jgi:dCTP deaminase
MTSGVLPAQALRQLIATGALAASPDIRADQIQPASLDLRLGPVAYRVRASFLAGQGRTVQERLEEFTMHKVNLADGAVLEKNCVYVIPLAERLALPQGVTAVANAKSSSGRLDLLTAFPKVTTARSTPRSARAASRSSSAKASASIRSASARARPSCPTPTWPRFTPRSRLSRARR